MFGQAEKQRENERTWNARVQRVRLLVNAVLVVDALALPALAAGTLLGMALYAGRRAGGGEVVATACCALAFLSAVAWASFQLRGRLFQRCDAAAFLDECWGLHAALSAREEWGIPAPARPGAWPFRLRSARSFAFLAGGLLLAAAGAWLPLPREEAVAVLPELPPALEGVLRAVEEMEKMADVRAEDVAALREQLELLQRNEAADMYSHAGLEAADALKQKTASALLGLESQLERAGSALAPMARGRGATAASLASLREALAETESLDLRPGGNLGRQLQELFSDDAARELDATSARQLRERLAQSAQQLRDLEGRCGWCSVVSPDGEAGMPLCAGGSKGALSGGEEEGQLPGNGGLGRGRGDAPLAFRSEERERLATDPHRLENVDLSRAAFADALGVEGGAPPPADEAGGVESGGKAALPARGGDAVFQDAPTPAEQVALKYIFR